MRSEEQFNRFFAQQRTALTLRARAMMGDNAVSEADDLVHNAYLRGIRYLRRGNAIDSPLHFLLRTIRNLIVDTFRAERVRRGDSDIEVSDMSLDGGASTVEEQVLSAQERALLYDAVHRLPRKMRQAFLLRKVDGCSLQEIADRLGRSKETVRKQVLQAFNRIHKEINKPSVHAARRTSEKTAGRRVKLVTHNGQD